MSLDKETVRRIATLARLKVPEEDLDVMAGELNNILGWIEQLSEVDTEGVAPMTSVTDTTPMLRADRVTDGDCADLIMANAPEEANQSFVVPKVIE
ncbi:MAG: Asp-tRNA(Asn)/Glu-tRNA(Gln) amidotransferase subunit GatC [Rhodospirillaceae bacterium]|jgi:aspartyl-tRNA(Asn)/glutamyl-tRNA(Gln) amidotransferase subunit C|nr:Asp-tRNA(Asn)/Glu-tRNA(Gln) amidotransferase subunit GatC [Rhodospirillaceae bacterium]